MPEAGEAQDASAAGSKDGDASATNGAAAADAAPAAAPPEPTTEDDLARRQREKVHACMWRQPPASAMRRDAGPFGASHACAYIARRLEPGRMRARAGALREAQEASRGREGRREGRRRGGYQEPPGVPDEAGGHIRALCRRPRALQSQRRRRERRRLGGLIGGWRQQRRGPKGQGAAVREGRGRDDAEGGERRHAGQDRQRGWNASPQAARLHCPRCAATARRRPAAAARRPAWWVATALGSRACALVAWTRSSMHARLRRGRADGGGWGWSTRVLAPAPPPTPATPPRVTRGLRLSHRPTHALLGGAGERVPTDARARVDVGAVCGRCGWGAQARCATISSKASIG